MPDPCGQRIRTHRLQQGLPGYLILFAAHAFMPERQLQAHRLLAGGLGLTHFSTTLGMLPMGLEFKWAYHGLHMLYAY